ncbi:uncharacterized protein TNCT_547281 [Trichonephila clavata]|uniref:Uncharacterized protein n=1 Tax=Trichonephila clavata TaxID=2740835 RepID=A0A8X6FTU3_TRICU|nr:uncharacterized protein TNCT_547281 [Trichonephila clavata]
MLIKISSANCEKRKNEFRRKVVFFQQDIARSHVSAKTGWTLYSLEMDLMQHLPYNPDMATLDYYLFLHRQLHLDGTILPNDEVINEVDRFLDSCTPQLFAEEI